MSTAGVTGSRRAPPADWEAYFLIAIFDPELAGATGEGGASSASSGGDEPRWAKLQLFSGGRRGRGWCLSAAEGMNGDGVELLLLGHAGQVESHRRALGPASAGGLRRATSGWDVATRNVRWTGTSPELVLTLDEPRVVARTVTPQVVRWAALGKTLTYSSALGSVDWNGRRGVALVEHAFGAESPIALSALVPRRWHWDVLVTGEGRAAAGLALGEGRRCLAVPAGGGLLDEGPLQRGRGLLLHRVDWSNTQEAQGPSRCPERWEATLRLARGSLSYVARRSTPVARVMPHGGFLGFDWEGEWRERGTLGASAGRGRPLSGRGFTEYAAR